jgi:hypothetical protein
MAYRLIRDCQRFTSCIMTREGLTARSRGRVTFASRPGRSIDEMQSHSDGGKQSTPQRLSAAFCADLRPAITKARSSQNCAILLSFATITDLFYFGGSSINEASHVFPDRRRSVSYGCRHRRRLPSRDRYLHPCGDDLKQGHGA